MMTPKRLGKIKQVLAQRQPDLTAGGNIIDTPQWRAAVDKSAEKTAARRKRKAAL